MRKSLYSAMLALCLAVVPFGAAAFDVSGIVEAVEQEQVDENDGNAFMASLNGEWTITKVGHMDISPEENDIYVNFESARGRFYCSNGCNILNGEFATDANDVIKFANVLTTMRACPDNGYSSQISAVFVDGSSVHAVLSREGTSTVLSLLSSTGRQLMRLCRNNMAFMNGQWVVTSINNRAIDDEEANVFIDVDAMTVHGNTGCNYFNGRITMLPGVQNSVSFTEMGVTRMACEKSAQETAMLVALEQATKCVQGEDSTMLLIDDTGKHVITLRRVEISH